MPTLRPGPWAAFPGLLEQPRHYLHHRWLLSSVFHFAVQTHGCLSFGRGLCKSMGINIRVFRAALIIISSVLSACVTAFAGPFPLWALPFHRSQDHDEIRKAAGDYSFLLLVRSGVLSVCDLIARVAFAPTELAISTVTSLFGAPVVGMMVSRKRQRM